MASPRDSVPADAVAPASAPTRFRPTQCRGPIHLGYLRSGTEPGDGDVRVAEVRCECWRCDGCGRWRRQLHGQLIEAGFAEHIGRRREPFARFVTVTWPSDTGVSLASAADCANVTRMFRLWVEDVRRYYAPRLEYYVVKEPTRRGRLHQHALTFGPYLPKCSARRLPPGCVLGCGPDCSNPCHRAGGCVAEGRKPCVQALAHRRGLGFLDIRAVRGQRHAAAYIAKYLGKDHIGHPWPRYSRRSSYSRDFAPTTVGRLAKEWSARAYTAGVAAGHIKPRPPAPAGTLTSWFLLDTIIRRGPPAAFIGWPAGQGWTLNLEQGTVRHLGSTQTADLDTGEVIKRPWGDLSERAWLRRMSRCIQEAAAAIISPTDPILEDPTLARLVYAEARRRAYTDTGMTGALR